MCQCLHRLFEFCDLNSHRVVFSNSKSECDFYIVGNAVSCASYLVIPTRMFKIYENRIRSAINLHFYIFNFRLALIGDYEKGPKTAIVPRSLYNTFRGTYFGVSSL